jgi:hypothetical protein
MDAAKRLMMIAERERSKRQCQELSNRTPPQPTTAPDTGQPQPVNQADNAWTRHLSNHSVQ